MFRHGDHIDEGMFLGLKSEYSAAQQSLVQFKCQYADENNVFNLQSLSIDNPNSAT